MQQRPSLAQSCGLRLSYLEAPHPLDHQWFVATRSTSSRDIISRLDMEVFSWREYLADQLRMRGGVPQSYEYYLKSELKNRVAIDDATIVPQARL
jgi:hypothetical protein